MVSASTSTSTLLSGLQLSIHLIYYFPFDADANSKGGGLVGMTSRVLIPTVCLTWVSQFWSLSWRSAVFKSCRLQTCSSALPASDTRLFFYSNVETSHLRSILYPCSR